MKVLMITPELAPFVKVGGLADVAGALPRELDKQGDTVRIVCPLYGCIEKGDRWIPYDIPLKVPLGGSVLQARIWETRLPGTGIEVYFIEFNEFFEREGVYGGAWGGHPDNDRRFTFLCRAALNLCYYLGWIPDLVHCHDWPTALVPLMLNTTDFSEPLGRAAAILTVHSMQHQGVFSRDVISFANLPGEVFRPDGLESNGRVNFLKGGLYNATKITTVSAHYAEEIQTPEYGCGLEAVLKYRAGDLIGIINGIDTEEWDPASDTLLPARFSARDMKGKQACKSALQKAFSLENRPDVPVFASVSRFYWQKGLDMLAAVIPEIMGESEVQMTILGNGDAKLEKTFLALAVQFPGRVGVHIGFNNPLSHLAYAGADLFLMPSRYEPCGLSQLYAMAYGTPPIVRSTGGLVDTVTPFLEGEEKGDGFVFREPTEKALLEAIRRSCFTFCKRPRDFRKLRERGMRRDFSWKRSARRYRKVYRWAMDLRSRI